MVVGATASGKTAVAVALAQRLNGELVSADSRQVVRGCDIGTNKPRAEELRGVPCHLVDLVEPGEPFTVADYQQHANRVIAEVVGRGHLPILVGGTGLYIRSVLDGYNLAGAPPSPPLRAALETRLAREGIGALDLELRRLDPGAAVRAQRNPRRVIRALEIYGVTGRAPTAARAAAPPYRSTVLGLRLPLVELDRRIAVRVERMLEAGLVDEVCRLRARYPALDLATLGIGYAEIAHYLTKTWSLAESRDAILRQTRRYARRQLTWFRADRRVRWVPDDPDVAEGQLRAAMMDEEAN